MSSLNKSNPIHSPHSISRRVSRKLQPCPFPLPFWHEFRIRGGCRLRTRCWKRCFRAVNCDNGRCTRLSSRWCHSRLEKISIWSGTNPPLSWFLRHFGYCCLHRLVPGCDWTRYCHHLPVTIGCPSEWFLIDIHEWVAHWASSGSIFRTCASQTASLSSLGYTMSNTTWRWEVRIHQSTPRSARQTVNIVFTRLNVRIFLRMQYQLMRDYDEISVNRANGCVHIKAWQIWRAQDLRVVNSLWPSDAICRHRSTTMLQCGICETHKIHCFDSRQHSRFLFLNSSFNSFGHLAMLSTCQDCLSVLCWLGMSP